MGPQGPISVLKAYSLEMGKSKALPIFFPPYNWIGGKRKFLSALTRIRLFAIRFSESICFDWNNYLYNFL